MQYTNTRPLNRHGQLPPLHLSTGMACYTVHAEQGGQVWPLSAKRRYEAKGRPTWDKQFIGMPTSVLKRYVAEA
eukprot:1162102-Pelagomonas_calceolata.AAC.4